MGFDLQQTRLASTAKMYLFHPTSNEPITDEDGEQAYIELAGMDSEVYREAERKLRDAFVDEALKRDTEEFKMDVRDIEGYSSRLFAECTVSWSGIDWEGEPLECTYENALMLYTAEGLHWLWSDVNKFISRRRNFKKKS